MSDLTAPSPRSRLLLLMLLALAAGASVLAIVAISRKAGAQRPNVLLVHCAASLKTPLEAIAADYRRDAGVRIEISLGGSQTLLANIEIARQGDLYLPADESYIAFARQRKLVKEVFPVAEQTAVIAVPKGNPRRIRSLASFQNSALTLSQANPETAAMGKLLRDTLEPGLWQALSNCTKVFKPNVNDAANDVKLGAVDAAVIWDSMQSQYPDLDFIRAPELEQVRARVAAAVLECSRRPEAARQFAQYVASPKQGLRHFKNHGFNTVSSGHKNAHD